MHRHFRLRLPAQARSGGQPELGFEWARAAVRISNKFFLYVEA